MYCVALSDFLRMVDTLTFLTVIVGPHCRGSMQLRALESLSTAVLLSTPASSFVVPQLLVKTVFVLSIIFFFKVG